MQGKRSPERSRAAVVRALHELARRKARLRILDLFRQHRVPVDPVHLERVDGEWWNEAGLPRPAMQRELVALLKGQITGHRTIAGYFEGEARKAWLRWGRPAQSIEDCGTRYRVMRCTSNSCVGNHEARVDLPVVCLSRYCPECCRLRRKRTQKRITRVLQRFKNRIRFATFTVRSRHNLRQTLADLLDAWKRFLRRRWVRRRMHGGVMAIEVTYSATHGWHPHLHVAYDGNYMAWSRVVDEWSSCAGCTCKRKRGDRQAVQCCKSTWRDRGGRFQQCHGCDCAGARAEPTGFNVKGKSQRDTARELGKYCAKELGQAQPNLPLNALCEFLEVTWGRRMLTTFGTHYDPALDAEEEELDRRAMREVFYDNKPRCPVCHGDDLDEAETVTVGRGPPGRERDPTN